MSSTPFRDAEAWLAERGVRRDPLRVQPPTEASGPEQGADATTAPADAETPQPATSTAEDDPAPAAPVTAREAVRLATASDDETLRRADEAHASDAAQAPRLEDDVAEAVAFARRSTAGAPQAEARVAGKLRERGWPDAVVEPALARCRELGMVDDDAMAAALVDEGRRKGHAPTRLRADLRRRELSEESIAAALAPVEAEDPEAAAFAVARDKADRLTGVAAETAFRRVVNHVARRGYPEALARKVARLAVFDARDAERVAGH